MISPVIYCSPSGLELSKAATLYLNINTTEESKNSIFTTTKFPILAAAYRWDEANEKWVRKSDRADLQDNLYELSSMGFSSYVILAPFNETYVIKPTWFLVESIGWGLELWIYCIFIPAGVLMCCFATCCYLFIAKRYRLSKETDKLVTDTVAANSIGTIRIALGYDQKRLSEGDSEFDTVAYVRHKKKGPGELKMEKVLSAAGQCGICEENEISASIRKMEVGKMSEVRTQTMQKNRINEFTSRSSTDQEESMQTALRQYAAQEEVMPEFRHFTKTVVENMPAAIEHVDEDYGTIQDAAQTAFMSSVGSPSAEGFTAEYSYEAHFIVDSNLAYSVTTNAASIRNVRLQRRTMHPRSATSQSGVGLLIDKDMSGRHVVTNMILGGPAAESGQIFIGDKLISIDSVPVHGLSRREVGELMHGADSSVVNVTFKSTGQLTSTRMVDAAMSPSDIEPELHLLRTSTALPSLRRLLSLQPLAARQTPTGSAQYAQGRPDVVRNSETAVRRRADLDDPALLHVHNRGPRIPDLLSGAAGATTGRQATAGPRFDHHRSKVDSAMLFLSQTLLFLSQTLPRP